MSARANSLAVRNPVATLPGVRAALDALPPEARAALATVLLAIRTAAAAKAAEAWKRHKAPMACYWKAVSVYAGHIAKSLKHTTQE